VGEVADDHAELMASLAGDLDPTTRQLLGLFDVPAYVRRALRVEEAIRSLQTKVRNQRADFMIPIRQAHGRWCQAALRYPQASRLLSPTARETIHQLPRHWADDPPIRIIPLLWPVRPKRVLSELIATIPRFNDRWSTWLGAVDLDAVNQLIGAYNRHYLVEKECAFRSAPAAGRGFRPMPLVRRADILNDHPLLDEIES
jgi:hypothetical protein